MERTRGEGHLRDDRAGLAELQQPGLAGLVRLAESTAYTAPLPVFVPPGCPRCLKRRQRSGRVRIIAAIIAVISLAAGAVIIHFARPQPLDLSVPSGSQPYSWPGRAPAGLTLSGLQNYVISPHMIYVMERQVRASRLYWHSNAVRLQIVQDRLVGAHGNGDSKYYMYVIRKLVHYSIHMGLKVVLNAQTEQSVGFSRDEPLPTRATRKFWDLMLHYYQDNPHVIFDLFNEPRHCSWQQWYRALQPLVTHIRNTDADNAIWVDGRQWGSTLEGVPLLHEPHGFPPIVYTIHHPGSTTGNLAPVNRELWWQSFGYLAARGVPVVDAEFANYLGSYHWKHMRKTVPRYLKYLTRYHVGMMAWSLVPGALNSGPNYTSCSRPPQGDGCMAREWFGKTSGVHYHKKRKAA